MRKKLQAVCEDAEKAVTDAVPRSTSSARQDPRPHRPHVDSRRRAEQPRANRSELIEEVMYEHGPDDGKLKLQSLLPVRRDLRGLGAACSVSWAR